MRRRVWLVWGVAALLWLALGRWQPPAPAARFLFPAWGKLRFESLYISESGKVVEIPGLESTSAPDTVIEPTANGCLYPAQKDGLWGYVSADGRWKIAPQYRYAGPFREDRAQVLLADLRNACIDPWGDVRFQWSGGEIVGQFGDGVAVRYRATEEDTVALDLLDAQGRLLASGIRVDKSCLDPVWSEIDGRTVYRETRHFSEGLLAASLEGRYGYLDPRGGWAIEPQYEDAQPFSGGLAAVCRDGKYGYIDRGGREVIPCVYERAQPFSEGLGAVKVMGGGEWDWQFLDPAGKVVFSLEHRCFPAEIGPDTLVFHEGLCCAAQADHWAYYDRTGAPVIRIEALRAGPFHNGLAFVTEYPGADGYINASGEWVYRCDSNFLWEINAYQNDTARLYS